MNLNLESFALDKKIVHEIGNYIHQIVSYSEYISQQINSNELATYTDKIKNAAYSIDAIISDSTAKKNLVDVSTDSINSIDFKQFVGMKVMIVDDIDKNIEIMKNIFSTFSCEISSANSGEKALELYNNGFVPEFVCMDMIMPGINGAETTTKLKELGSNAFFMAVSALKNQPKEIISVFDYWMPKPFTMENIVSALSKFKSVAPIELPKEKPVNDDLLNVLIVDDEPENLVILSQMLNSANLNIFVALGGKKALQRVDEQSFDLILLDVIMPDVDGYSVCKSIKNNYQTKDIPVIFISVLSSTEDKLKGFSYGGDDYISKPVIQKELLARVNLHLHKRVIFKSLKQLLKKSYHELYNPLFIINTSLEMQNIKHGSSRYTDAIGVASKTLQLVYDDFYYCLSDSKQEESVVSINLFDFVKSRVVFFNSLLITRNLIVDLKFTQESMIEMRKVDLLRVIDNTLSNAIKYAKSASEIYINIASDDIYSSFECKNSGSVIKDTKKIFDKGYRESYEQIGMGIGLEIVSTICHKYKIQTEVISNNSTTSFLYKIPKKFQGQK